MKIYIGNREIQDQEFKKITDIKVLDVIVDDSECNVIVLDNILSKYGLQEAINNLNIAIRKLRIGGTVIINDIDFDLLTYLYRKNPNIIDLNNSMNAFGGFKSFLTNFLLLDIMKNFQELNLLANSFNGIEFRMEFLRK